MQPLAGLDAAFLSLETPTTPLHVGVVLVLDGAYAEFNRNPDFTDGLDLARNADNIVVPHTFSKLHGLAALRVGWAYAPVAISDAEMAARRAAWVAPAFKASRGTLAKYAKCVSSATLGAVTDLE